MTDRIGSLVADLVAARDEFIELVEGLGPPRLTTPGLVDDWSGQQLIAHVGYWAGHAVELIQSAEHGTLESFDEGQPSVDDVNATVARVAREAELATVQARERASFDVLAERVRRLDPELLELRLPDGATVEMGIREDGPEHYRLHGDELRRAIGSGG